MRRFYEGVCAAIAGVDARVPCVVGPTPFYKVWNLNETLILRQPDGQPRKDVIYTFDFYDPWEYVTSTASNGYTYPGVYPCSVAFRGWVSSFCPLGPTQSVAVNKAWLLALLERNPLQVGRESN